METNCTVYALACPNDRNFDGVPDNFYSCLEVLCFANENGFKVYDLLELTNIINENSYTDVKYIYKFVNISQSNMYISLVNKKYVKMIFVTDIARILSGQNPLDININSVILEDYKFSYSHIARLRRTYKYIGESNVMLIDKLLDMLIWKGKPLCDAFEMIKSFRNGVKPLKISRERYKMALRHEYEYVPNKNHIKGHFKYKDKPYTLSDDIVNKLTIFINRINYVKH